MTSTSSAPRAAGKKAQQNSANASASGLLLVLSGPSGVGKDTIWRAAAPCLPTFKRAVTCTTRVRREGEEEGVNYYFVSETEFDRLINEDQLLEWAHVHGCRYGVPAGPVVEALNQNSDIVCVIDVQGAQRIRSLFPISLLVFLTPPEDRAAQILEERIMSRDSEIDRKELQDRLARVQWEMEHIPLYDHTIVNDTVQNAADQLCEIVRQEKQKR